MKQNRQEMTIDREGSGRHSRSTMNHMIKATIFLGDDKDWETFCDDDVRRNLVETGKMKITRASHVKIVKEEEAGCALIIEGSREEIDGIKALGIGTVSEDTQEEGAHPRTPQHTYHKVRLAFVNVFHRFIQ